MIKKLWFALLIVLLILWTLRGYFFYMGTPDIVRWRIQTHPLYTAIFFVSIISIYLIRWEDKIRKILVFTIIVGNIILIGNLFFKNAIGLTTLQFLLVSIGILAIRGIAFIKHWVRGILISICCIGILFVLLAGILPMYHSLPDITAYSIPWQKILHYGTDEGVLMLSTNVWTKEFSLKNSEIHNIDFRETTDIRFASPNVESKVRVFVDMGHDWILNIKPQSAIIFSETEKSINVEIIQWNVEYYIPEDFPKTFTILGGVSWNTMTDTTKTYRMESNIYFQEQAEKQFIEALWWELFLHPILHTLVWWYIKALYTISPNTYQNNIDNYTIIQKYRGNEPIDSIPTIREDDTSSLWQDIRSQMKKGGEETLLLKKRLQ